MRTQILNFTQAQFKIPNTHCGAVAVETRKCPEVQSFAVNADELGLHGAGGNTLVGRPVPAECSAGFRLYLQCSAGFQVHCAGFSLSPSCAAPQAPTALLPASSAPPLLRVTLQKTLQALNAHLPLLRVTLSCPTRLCCAPPPRVTWSFLPDPSGSAPWPPYPRNPWLYQELASS